jgi:small-conductance mechanosensitive channel
VVKTQPLQQWAVARELRRRIKDRFDAEGIHVAHPASAVWLETPGQTRPAEEDETPAAPPPVA